MSLKETTLADGRTKSYYAILRVNSTQRWIFVGHQKREAKRLHDSLVVANNRRALPEMKDITFGELADRYFLDGVHDLRPQTISSYRSKATNHLLPYFSSVRVRKSCTVERIQGWVTWSRNRGTSDTSIRAAFTTLSALFSYGVRIGLLANNPCRMVKPPRCEQGGVETVLSPHQVALVIKNTPKQDRAMMMFLFMVGTRPNEAAEVRWRDISLSDRTVTISRTATAKGANGTKTGKVRVVPLPPSLLIALSEQRRTVYQGEDSLVFPTQRGCRHSMSRFAKDTLRPALTRCGLNSEVPEGSRTNLITRKSFCSILLDQGVPITTVAEWAGNSPSILAAHYAKTRKEQGHTAMLAFDDSLSISTAGLSRIAAIA